MSQHTDLHFMREALHEAALAARAGEVPVGAVVVHQGQVIGRGHNRSIGLQDATAHAEIQALREASRVLGNYRLEDCTLYVTLEPCLMCSGALLGARLRRVVFGATEPKTGAAGSVLDVFADRRLNHHTEVKGGVLTEECGQVLQQFFQHRRQARQAERSATFLRDDALRTPAQRQPAWPAGVQSTFIHHLPSLAGHRLHLLQAGQGRAAVLALHDSGQWSAAYAQAAQPLADAGLALCAPDLIGFGLSDKPKKPVWHTLARHAAVLREVVQSLEQAAVYLLAPLSMRALVAQLMTDPVLAERLRGWVAVTADLPDEWLDLPYPDAGHRVGPRVLAPLLAQADAVLQPSLQLDGPDWPAQLVAMGYCAP